MCEKYFVHINILFFSKSIFDFEVKEKDDKIEALEKQLMDEALIVDEINLEYSKSPIICQETIKQTRVNASNYEAMYITKDCGYVKKTQYDHCILVHCRRQN